MFTSNAVLKYLMTIFESKSKYAATTKQLVTESTVQQNKIKFRNKMFLKFFIINKLEISERNDCFEMNIRRLGLLLN